MQNLIIVALLFLPLEEIVNCGLIMSCIEMQLHFGLVCFFLSLAT